MPRLHIHLHEHLRGYVRAARLPVRYLLIAALAAPLAATGTRAADDDDAALSLDASTLFTASTGNQTVMSGLVSRIAPVDMAAFTATIEAYRKGEVSAGDARAATLTDQSAQAAAEWLAIRANPVTIRFARISRFMETYPDWPNGEALQRRAEEALSMERLPSATTLSFFKNREPLTPVGRVALARAWSQNGEGAKARELIRATWARDPLSAATEKLILQDLNQHLDEQIHVLRFKRMVFQGNFNAALRVSGKVSSGYMALARAQMAAANKGGNAASLLASVPADLQKDWSYRFTKAQILRRADKPVEAAAAMAGAPRDPALLADGDEWWVERRLIARKLLDIDQREQAYSIAAGHGAETPAKRIEAKWHAGWIALQFLNDPARAAQHFDAIAAMAETPHSLARAAYWQGRAARAAGNETDAERLFLRGANHPLTYHGQLARAELGDTRPLVNQPQARPDAPFLAMRAVRLLQAANASEPAQRLMLDMALSAAPERSFTGLMAASKLSAQQQLAIGRTAIGRHIRLDEAAFPIHGVPDVDMPGDVERAMVHAIARQESAFNPMAVSGAGARGLMQMMPATARETARRFALPHDPSRLTGDPAHSARLGAAHLADLMKEWRGSYVLTFAAYNAGSGNVKEWIAAYGDPRNPEIDAIDWIERIPFTETRQYVQKILENLQVYRARLQAGPMVVTAQGLSDDLRRGRMLSKPNPVPAIECACAQFP